MKDLLQRADEIPVTLVIAVAFITLAFLTDPFAPTTQKLYEFGSLTPLAVSSGEPWRLLSHAFLHGGLMHLGFNTWFLLVLGPSLERALGSVRMLLLYVVAALGAGVSVCLVYPVQQPVVGGSGALFGMMGAIVAMQVRQGRHALAFLDYEGPRRILGLIAVNLVIGFLIPFISNTAHVGGLLTGFVFTLLWLVPPRAPAPGLLAWRAATAALLAGLLFHAVMPVTRYDWLWNRSVTEQNDTRRRSLQRAAVMSYFGIDDPTARDIERFRSEVLEPVDEPPKRRGG